MAVMDSLTDSRGWLGGRDGEIRLGNRRSVQQLLKAAVGHHVAGIDSRHRCLALVRNSSLNIAHYCFVVLNQVNVTYRSVMLDRRIRYQRLILQRLDQQPRVHELVWKQ